MNVDARKIIFGGKQEIIVVNENGKQVAAENITNGVAFELPDGTYYVRKELRDNISDKVIVITYKISVENGKPNILEEKLVRDDFAPRWWKHENQ